MLPFYFISENVTWNIFWNIAECLKKKKSRLNLYLTARVSIKEVYLVKPQTDSMFLWHLRSQRCNRKVYIIVTEITFASFIVPFCSNFPSLFAFFCLLFTVTEEIKKFVIKGFSVSPNPQETLKISSINEDWRFLQ